ncbi:hypothetical protein C5612_28645 [Pseudomonas frederiksbergensis]|uniref:Uncharacterized protein n=1 Tax=Pseudomonas frederiksbergensis TaxID=104087 RepID=A0A2S8H695_9PSED|nr:hypothetical protein C5612_28645 [Pseudomonas frederiksbergensis]
MDWLNIHRNPQANKVEQTLHPPVGAGLLAKAARQSTSMLPVRPLSRASPLPQWICVAPSLFNF